MDYIYVTESMDLIKNLKINFTEQKNLLIFLHILCFTFLLQLLYLEINARKRNI